MDILSKLFHEQLKVLSEEDASNLSELQIKEKQQQFIDEALRVLKPKLHKIAIQETIKKNTNKNQFVKNNIKRWRIPFQVYEAHLCMCIDIGNDLNLELNQGASVDIVFDTLVKLHANACHIADEIICLLKNGYANAAHSRWRALHETSIIAIFIHSHGEECAERYINHSIIDAYNIMQKFIKFRGCINQTPPSEAQFSDCQLAYQKITSKYEKGYERPYGWASPYMAKGKSCFSGLEESVGCSIGALIIPSRVIQFTVVIMDY